MVGSMRPATAISADGPMNLLEAVTLATRQLTHAETHRAMLHSLFQHYRGGSMSRGLKMPDLCALAYLAKPELFTTQACHVAVETQGELTRGTTCVDLANRLKLPANAEVCLEIDVEGSRQWLLEMLTHPAVP